MADIALLGDRNPAFVTHRAVDAALGQFPEWARGRWIATGSAQASELGSYDGVWLLPGTPYQDEDLVCATIRQRREHRAPMLGTCGGFQYMVLEYARHVAGAPEAAHAETEPEAEVPVITPLSCSLVGQERTVRCEPGTKLAEICGIDPFTGFHWCSFGLAEDQVGRLTAAGLVVSAHAEDAGVEGIELPGHPFFIATLFQPQVEALGSGRLHPLIHAFLTAARER